MTKLRSATLVAGAAASVAAIALVPAKASPGAPGAVRPCTSRVSFGVLPVWARDGFSSPRPHLPHVVARGGRIAALIFGYPLLSPPSEVRSNKILWVDRRDPASPGGALWIHAQRMVGARAVGRPATRVVAGGPGPSIVDLPKAGCWRLTLSWSGWRDTLDLRYRHR